MDVIIGREPKRQPVLISLRNAFFSGLLLLAPVGVTVFVVNFLVGKLGAPTTKLFFFFLPPDLFDQTILVAILNVLATLLVLIFITILGWFSKLLMGRMIVNGFERLVTNVPFVRSVYRTVKHIVETFSAQNKAVFQKVVLIEFPRAGMYAIGFMTREGAGEIKTRTGQDLLNIFLPTTPNPTSGYLLIIPRKEVRFLDMTVAEGMKFIISGGAVVPDYPTDPDAVPWKVAQDKLQSVTDLTLNDED